MAYIVRRVESNDVDAVVGLVHEFADYERERELCLLTANQLRAALFGSAPALFGHIVEGGGIVVGYAVWFLSFSTWKGEHGIWVEDMYVRPEHRGHGLGRAILAEIAGICVERGYGRLDWSVLDWNAPAIGLYRSIDAVKIDNRSRFRLAGQALARFSAERPAH